MIFLKTYELTREIEKIKRLQSVARMLNYYAVGTNLRKIAEQQYKELKKDLYENIRLMEE